MEVVTGATGSVLTKVGALLQEEYIRQKGVQKDVEYLQTELLFMRAALCKVAEVPPDQLDEQVKAWASNVKELSYDMEDAVDTFNVRVTATKVNGRAWSLDLNKFSRLIARHQLADVIAEMKELTMQVAELRDRYKLDSINVSNTVEQVQDANGMVSTNILRWTWWRDGICYQIQEVWARWQSGRIKLLGAANHNRQENLIPRLIGMKDLYGRRDDMEKLGEWVSNVSGASVLYVVGDRGVGKTTIATALYRKFGHLFHRRATVTASSMRPSDIAILIHKLNQQLGTSISPATVTTSSMDCRGNGIPEDLETKKDEAATRYLVLIDHVESDKLLEKLLETTRGFWCSGSKIIVTTRLSAVASLRKNGRGDMRYDIVVPGEKEAKIIFDEALSEKTSCVEDGDGQKKEITTNNNNNKIPPRVWEMCKDQPVAIVAMAGYAACNPDKSVDAWKQVCSRLLPESVKALTRDGVPRVLCHCYHDMSAEIKTCTLYLSMYPKGQKMSRKNLTRRWIAEGFVAEKPGKSVEEVADDYLAQLIKRKMIEPVELSINGRVRNLIVYDMVHDFIVSKASEENLVTVVGHDYSRPPQSGKVRRLSHTVLPLDDGAGAGAVGRQRNTNSSVNMSHVRSLSVFWAFNSNNALLPPGSLDSPIVQVLDLQGCKDELLKTKHMAAICRMFLLKYLGLRGTCISELGREIGSLKNLETLDVRETEVQELPDTVWKLEQLVNILGGNKKTRKALKLRLPGAKKTTKDGSKIKTKALRVLSGIEITQELAVHLEHLPNLRKLAIYKVNADTNLEKSMLQFLSRAYLQNLVIIGDDNLSGFFEDPAVSILPTSLGLLTGLDLSGKLDKLPTWIQELVHLEKLTLPITPLLSENLKEPPPSDPPLLGKLSNLKNLFSLTFLHVQTPGSDAELQPLYGKEIVVPAGGYVNLRLLRFFAPRMPHLSFLDEAMSSLEKIHLRFKKFDALHGLHNLRIIQEVHLEVHGNADDLSMTMVDNLVAATRQAAEGPRIILDRYTTEDMTTSSTSMA